MDIKTAESRADMVLTSSNDQLPVSDSKAFKYALNLCMNRRDLGAASLLSGCTVMSYKAINVLGWESLLCPPLAQIKGMLQGLTVKKGVPKGVREGKVGDMEKSEYLAAFHYLTQMKGRRGLFENDGRQDIQRLIT